jgi:dTDP-4-amino-4,6-dideoxygalactose transaminase
MDTIPFLDLRPQNDPLRAEFEAATARVIASGQFTLGPEVEAFEREFAAYCGTRHAVALNSGTSALHLGLLALGVGPGDEVITVAHTFFATVEAILYIGAKPVFVDIHPNTMVLDTRVLEQAITPRTRAILPVHLYGNPVDMGALREIADRHHIPVLEQAITPRTRAILPVHLYGNPVDMGALREIADRHHIPVLEDACQAHGAVHRGRKVGGWGAAAAFSFYPTKNLGTTGEGGILTTDDETIAETARSLRNHGQSGVYRHDRVGFNYRMTAFQGAVLRVKLPHLDDWNEDRRRLAAVYRQGLEGSRAQVMAETPESTPVYHLLSVLVTDRDRIQKELAERGVQTRVYYPLPLHRQPAVETARFTGSRLPLLPVTDSVAAQVLSLPLWPGMREEQVGQVMEVLKEVLD